MGACSRYRSRNTCPCISSDALYSLQPRSPYSPPSQNGYGFLVCICARGLTSPLGVSGYLGTDIASGDFVRSDSRNCLVRREVLPVLGVFGCGVTRLSVRGRAANEPEMCEAA